METGLVIDVENLTKKFGEFTAVDAITFSVSKGEIFGFLGANGAGKTTAMKMLCGLLKPTDGRAIVAGKNVFRHPEQVKQRIGYMSQRFSLYEDLTIIENMQFYGGIYGLRSRRLNNKIEEVIADLALDAEAHKKVGTLPLGWKQKLAFSVAMLHEPELVFLDEPTSGVDPLTRREFWERIYQAAAGGTTLFVTTHYMDEAEYCDRVSFMVDGVIKAIGTPSKLKEEYQARTIEEIFLKLAGTAKHTAD